MSFILDALKKSEMERQRQTIPGLVDSGTARPRQTLPLWAIALGVLLAINLGVLVFVVARGGLTQRAATAAPPAAQRGPAAIGPALAPGRALTGAAPPFSLRATAPAYAPEMPVASSRAALEQAAASLNGSGADNHPPHATRRRDPLLNEGDYKAEDAETLPSITELSLSGSQALPELHLDVHVYATRPADRFVYVNMRKYHEGATLEEGPTIERIRRDGVVLNYQGIRFLLPRQ